MNSRIDDYSARTPLGKGWVIFLIAWLVLTVLVYASAHDWKSANFLFLPYIPMYLLVWSGLYLLFGFGVRLLCTHLFPTWGWLPWAIILTYGLAPRLGRIHFAIKHWQYHAYTLVPVGIGFGLCLLWGAIGILCARRRCIVRTQILPLFFSLSLIVCVTDVPFVLDFVSTRGAWLQFAGRWESWKRGEKLPQGWETQELDGIRFVLRDHFIGHNKCHGYYLAPQGSPPPENSPWGRIADRRSLPGGWTEFLSSD